ncbi:MAG: acetate--CoA ligase family protein [Ignavibacteriaceae bacterium]
MNAEIKKFFYPSKITVVGASQKEKSIGYELLRSIKNYGFVGEIYPVNPNADFLPGYKCYKSIPELPDGIDLAIIVVPKQFVDDSLDNVLLKNIKSIILITAGFKEVGVEGAEFEHKIIEKVRASGARLVGPNCMGVINTFKDIKLNATFVAEKPETGCTAFLSQSGAIGAAVLNSLRETDIKFGHFISVGNKADICENDLLEFWQSDDNIKTIALYLESFTDGESFLKIISKEINFKPIIILKAGRTAEGIKAASSHTGAIGTSDKVVDAVLNQFGIIRVNTLAALFNTSKGFENFPPPLGNRIAVVTNAGGPAILAVDALGEKNLTLSKLNEETKNKLRAIVHQEGSVNNPVDLLPGGTAEQYKSVNEILLSDENVDAVISIFVEPVMVSPMAVIEAVNSIENIKPVFQVVMPLPEFWENYRTNSIYKKPLFRNPEEPAEVISNILFYLNKNKVHHEILPPQNFGFNLTQKSSFVSNDLINLMLKHYNIPIVSSTIISAGKINKHIEDFTFPIVLKGNSKKLVHKSELNAVKVNIKNINQLLEAEMEILENFKTKGIDLDEFLIQPYIKPRFEILIGGFRDPAFGPMIMFGSGGKYVEIYNDTAIKSAYLNDNDIDELIATTKMGRLLEGVRGETAIDKTKIKGIIKSAAQMMVDNPSILEFDFNPVIISEHNTIYAVDVRIKLS